MNNKNKEILVGLGLGLGILAAAKYLKNSEKSADEYVLEIINKKRMEPIKKTDERLKPIIGTIEDWDNGIVNDIKISGSSAKDLAIKGGSDVDLFLSIEHDSDTVKHIYNDLFHYLEDSGFRPKKQNVSVGITFNNLKIDLVPGRKQWGQQNYHTLYVRKTDSWRQTNIEKHIKDVVNSGRLDEIRATKIWKLNNNLDFPSIYLELSVIDALRNKNKNRIADNFVTVLEYLSDQFVDNNIIDPSNKANKISDLLYKKEKQEIEKLAIKSLEKEYWEDIIW